MLSANADFTTFHDLIDLWKKEHYLYIKSGTRLKYDFLIEKHIEPFCGKMSPAAINSAMINDYLQQLLSDKTTGKGLSFQYVKTIRLLYEKIIDHASSHDLMQSVKIDAIKSKRIKHDVQVLSSNNRILLEKQLFKDESPESLGILLALYTGMRIGEICALKWSDIDFTEGVIYVNHTVVRAQAPSGESTRTMLIIDEPKTISSHRIIPIADKIKPVLQKAKLNSGSDFVVSQSPSFVSPRTFESRFHKKLSAYNIPQINFHGLRHTFATRCIETGIDIKSLSEILGHANVSITLNTYVHSSLEFKKDQMNKLN